MALMCTSGCSSSSGAASSQGISYTGKTTQAQVSAANAEAIFGTIFGATATAVPAPVLAKTVSNRTGSATLPEILRGITGSVFRLHLGDAGSAKAVGKGVPYAVNGRVSGTMTYNALTGVNGAVSVQIVMSNYNDGGEASYDGSCTLTVTGRDPDSNVITQSTLDIPLLTARSASATLSLSGTITYSREVNSITEVETHNVCLRNEVTQETLKLVNYSSRRTYDNFYAPTTCSETSSGRLYLYALGYVDFSTATPFIYNHYNRLNIALPELGGPFLVNGAAGTSLKITPLSISQFRLEVDSNGDGSYEESRTCSWNSVTDVVYKFQKTIGTEYYDSGRSVKATSDGGYIVAGSTNSVGANSPDLYLVKTSALGEVEWQKTFGGTRGEAGRSVLETSDGGFLVAGYTYPNNMSYPFGFGGEEIYLVRTDASGNLLWEKKFSGQSQWAYSLEATADGGFILMGGITGNYQQVYLLKLSAEGEKQWDSRIGGGRDVANALAVAPDGGYVVAGYTGATWHDSIYLAGTDASGAVVWQKYISKTYDARANSVLRTSSGNFVVAGFANNQGYLACVDPKGNLLWEAFFEDLVGINAVVEAPDGGLVLAGTSQMSSTTALVKTDAHGAKLWQKAINTPTYSFFPQLSSLALAADGGFVATGNVDTSSNQYDIYLLKTDQNGNL